MLRLQSFRERCGNRILFFVGQRMFVGEVLDMIEYRLFRCVAALDFFIEFCTREADAAVNPWADAAGGKVRLQFADVALHLLQGILHRTADARRESS